MRILIAGGGTGGHLFPGLALADALAARGASVTFVGTAAGIEARAVPAAGYPLRLLPGRQLRGGGMPRALAGLASAAGGTLRALALLGELRPRLVVGVGGYASVAIVIAASFRRIPTGNPVRADLIRPRPPRARPGLLVFGGSAGAHRLNHAMLDALGPLAPTLAGLDLTHQTGAADLETVRAAYAARGLAARVEPFIADMGAAYAAADLVVARAGATTCAELTAVGLPAILVPYPYAADDHQRRNAEVLVRAGAAEMILDATLDGERLATALRALLADAGRRATMAVRARALGRPDAAERVAEECLRLAAA